MAHLSTADEARLNEFLSSTMIAVVATVGRDGMPQLTPNWFAYIEGRLVISTTRERVKYGNLMRDDRLAVCICSEPLGREYVTLRGRAEVRHDESIWSDTQAIVERYVAPDAVEERMQTLRRQNRVLINLVPERVVFRT